MTHHYLTLQKLNKPLKCFYFDQRELMMLANALPTSLPPTPDEDDASTHDPIKDVLDTLQHREIKDSEWVRHSPHFDIEETLKRISKTGGVITAAEITRAVFLEEGAKLFPSMAKEFNELLELLQSPQILMSLRI